MNLGLNKKTIRPTRQTGEYEMPKNQIVQEYPETHMMGNISIENIPEKPISYGDIGVQIAGDGRIWICINGIAFLRFKPELPSIK